MKYIITFLLFLGIFLVPPTVFAEEFVIDRFNSDIAIQNDGKVKIIENLDVDYRENEKHGIFREMPYIYEDNGKKTYTDIAIEKVLRNNSPEPYEVDKNDNNIRIKIGDTDKTISGKHQYQIFYTARGILRSFPEHDELYWNVTGNNWPTNIDVATTTVTLPKDGMQKAACFEGYLGSQGECRASVQSENTASFAATRFISEGEGMTIVAGFQKDIVPIITIPRPKTFWEKFLEWPSQATFWTGILGAIGFVTYTWYRNGRDSWFGDGVFGKTNAERVKPIGAHETIVVEFTPPEKLRPAELGVLMDERAHTHDIVATIIDLAGRGFLSITEVPKKWVFGSTDYELKELKKDKKELLTYENLLLTHLFDAGDIVTISSLKKSFYDELKEVKTQLYDDMVQKGYFPKNPEKVWENYLATGIVLLVFGGVGLSMTVANDLVLLADLCGAVIVAGLLLLLFSKFMPRRSAHGRELYRRARGYRLFIERSEKYRQQFFEKKHLFNEVLPYAMMFGLTDKFTSAMKDMGVQTNPTWYHSPNPFTYSAFNSSMNSFASSVGTAIASTPSSSGGFSGGGSSGGGFGGGGGGSW